jgi:hypothetical protein
MEAPERPTGPAAQSPGPPPLGLRWAAWLWVALGAITVVGALGVVVSEHYSVELLLVFLCYGVVVCVLARKLKRGIDTRIALTVLGVIITIMGGWPLLLVAPAIILQNVPKSRGWLSRVKRGRIAEAELLTATPITESTCPSCAYRFNPPTPPVTPNVQCMRCGHTWNLLR